jgi:hypothetical protein
MHRFIGRDARPRSEEGMRVARAALDQLRERVLRMHEADLLGGLDPEEVVMQGRLLVHGLAEFENLGLLGDDPEAYWRRTMGAMLDGVRRGEPTAA